MRITSFAVLALATATSVSAQQVGSSSFDALRYRYIGPEGNRISTAAGIPGDPNTYYAGAASGGIFSGTQIPR